MKRSRKDFDRDTLLAQLHQAQLGEKAARAREQAALARETTAKQDLAIRMGTATIVRSHAEASDMSCGSLETCSIDEILEGVPSVDDALIRERFTAMCAEKPVLPTVSDREIPAMHTFMERVLWLARPATSVLSIRHELKARVRDSKSSVIPDFSLSHRRNATFSMHTMDFCLELKRRRHRRKKRRLVLRGNAQAMDYATRKAGTRMSCPHFRVMSAAYLKCLLFQSTPTISSLRMGQRSKPLPFQLFLTASPSRSNELSFPATPLMLFGLCGR